MSTLLDRLQAAIGDAYLLERELPGGGMSRLFLANERALGRRVVVKVLPPELGSDVSIARFRREIELAARLQHPNILGVLTAGVDRDLVWYAMPFVEPESLRHRMDRDGPLPVAFAQRVLAEVADALDHAHRRGVIHRDVKPENILLAADHALLADFGIAHALAASRGDERLTVSGVSLGTPGYMAPEQAAGDAVDGRADIYALGLIGWEMLAGKPPFTGPDAQSVLAAHLTKQAPSLQSVRSDVAPSLDGAISRALAKDPADRFATAGELRDALSAAPSTRGSSRALPRAIAAAAIVLLAALAIWRLTSRQEMSSLDPNVVAVAPFDVHGADLELWREGLADILARDLDGAGPLRTVPPTNVVRRWSGRADSASARALAVSTGAGLAIFGALTRTGSDSVRLRATLFDVGAERTFPEVEVRDDAEHIDRLADSAAVRLLRELGRSRAIGAARLTSVGAKSISALKAFLRGEQLFRQGFMDSAKVEYERAVSLDTTFGIAYNRIGKTLGWLVGDIDSLSLAHRLRAGALAHGLSRRDSLLVLADSNHAAAIVTPSDTGTWRYARRTLALLNEAAREYPSDPQIWFELGEVSVHQVRFAPAPMPTILARFERAIEIDSQFSPAYPHAIEIAAALHDTAKVRSLTRAYWSKGPGTVERPAVVLLYAVLDRGLAALDSAAPNANVAHSLTLPLGYMLDSTELGVEIARRSLKLATVEGRRVAHAREHLASALAYRGHLRSAAEVEVSSPTFLVELAFLGGAARDSLARLFQDWLHNESESVRLALPYWALRHDTSAAAAALRQIEARARRATVSLERALLIEGVAQGRFFLALARRDTAAAVRLMPGLSDSLCLDGCDLIRFAKARTVASQGRLADARELFTPAFRTVVPPVTPLFVLERARVTERLGQREPALRDYLFVAQAWRSADPELRALVTEALQGIERLGGSVDAPPSRAVPRAR